MSISRLPIPGADDGQWGNLLNQFLQVEHQADGSLTRGSQFAAKYDKPSAGIPKSDLTSDSQMSLSTALTAVSQNGANLSGLFVFPASGFIVTDGSSRWRVTINTSGNLVMGMLNAAGGTTTAVSPVNPSSTSDTSTSSTPTLVSGSPIGFLFLLTAP